MNISSWLETLKKNLLYWRDFQQTFVAAAIRDTMSHNKPFLTQLILNTLQMRQQQLGQSRRACTNVGLVAVTDISLS